MSGIFFFLGLIFSKFPHLPVFFLSALFNLVAIGLYFLGYITWLTASFLQPDTAKIPDKWYGFAQFKQQSSISALIGTGATILTLATFFSHVLIVPGCWLFVVSNVFWCISEYHKFKNPPPYDSNYSPSQQKSYLCFCTSATGLSLLVATMTTLTFFLPAIAFFTVPFSTVIGIGVGLLCLYYWHDYQFGNHRANKNTSSFEKIEEHIGKKISPPTSRCTSDLRHTTLFKDAPDISDGPSMTETDDEYERPQALRPK